MKTLEEINFTEFRKDFIYFFKNEINQQEWNKFFRDYPQIVGMTGDLPEPGTFFTREDFGIPLLATRDEKGKFRAFANVCAHRGVIAENEKKCQKTKFSCPFHGWTYDNSGKLIGFPKPDHFGDIDKACYGLTELPCMEQYGFLWVHPNPKGEIDINNLFGSKLMEEFETWGFQNLILTNEEEYETVKFCSDCGELIELQEEEDDDNWDT